MTNEITEEYRNSKNMIVLYKEITDIFPELDLRLRHRDPGDTTGITWQICGPRENIELCDLELNLIDNDNIQVGYWSELNRDHSKYKYHPIIPVGDIELIICAVARIAHIHETVTRIEILDGDRCADCGKLIDRDEMDEDDDADDDESDEETE